MFITGRIVTHATANGNSTRRPRCRTSPSVPRRRHNIATKKPLNMKNNGMRKPWIISTTTASQVSWARSCTVQPVGT
jgi:hypothetical protein